MKTELIKCGLCNGKGKRFVKQPPYDERSNVKLEECCDCHGTGKRKRTPKYKL